RRILPSRSKVSAVRSCLRAVPFVAARLRLCGDAPQDFVDVGLLVECLQQREPFVGLSLIEAPRLRAIEKLRADVRPRQGVLGAAGWLANGCRELVLVRCDRHLDSSARGGAAHAGLRILWAEPGFFSD